MERAEAYRVHIEWALSQRGRRGKPISFNAAADRLNERHIPSPMGGRWSSINVRGIACRLGLRERPVRVSREALQARVRAVWKQYPDLTSKQVMDRLGPDYPRSIGRVWALLRNCWRAAARSSPAHRQMGWRVDRRTVARMRISAIWKRHPEFTAKQVIGSLGPRHSVPIRWVQLILRDCWQASGRHSPERRRVGRRCYSPWRGDATDAGGS